MGKFFSSENWVWKPFDLVADVFLLSCLWFVCSVPILTMGAATTALYDCVARCVRGKDERMFARFFRTFKNELIPSALCMALWGCVIGGLFSLVKHYGNSVEVTDTTTVITVALLLGVVVAVGVFCWVLPLLSRFAMGFGHLNATALKLALANLPRTMVLGIVTVVAGVVCIQLWIPFFFVPAVLALIWSWLLEPVFRKFMDETEE